MESEREIRRQRERERGEAEGEKGSCGCACRFSANIFKVARTNLNLFPWMCNGTKDSRLHSVGMRASLQVYKWCNMEVVKPCYPRGRLAPRPHLRLCPAPPLPVLCRSSDSRQIFSSCFRAHAQIYLLSAFTLLFLLSSTPLISGSCLSPFWEPSNFPDLVVIF